MACRPPALQFARGDGPVRGRRGDSLLLEGAIRAAPHVDPARSWQEREDAAARSI
jgi:hypothetical protein